MIYLTSDCHFNHQNILTYESQTRPFNSIEEMNETIIQNWNNTVSDNDDIYVLGDFFMGSIENIIPILNRLKGHIHLIRGNHDTKNRIKLYEENGIDVKDIDYIRYKDRFFILCHFPIMNDEFSQMVRKDNSEVIWLYGHIHSHAPKGYVDGSYHVGVDTNNMTPISLERIWQESWPDEIMTPAVKEYKEQHNTDNFCE